ncbi:hypothetical protein ACE4Z2_25465, partial [Salmonella enterica]
DRSLLKELLHDLTDDGTLERGRGRRVQPPAALPEIAVIEITGLDADGELQATPIGWQGDGPAPKIIMLPERSGQAALAVGDRVLAR